MYARITSWTTHQDLSTLIQYHTRELLVEEELDELVIGSPTLFVSRDFPFCPQLTHFIAKECNVDNSVPAAFTKAVKDGKFPNLRRIDIRNCTLHDCEWPEVPEFSLETGSLSGKKSDTQQMQKLILNLTELTVHKSVDLDRVITGRLEKLSVLKVRYSSRYNRHCLNSLLRKGHLPDLTELFVDALNDKDGGIISTLLREFDPSKEIKPKKLTLRNFHGLSREDLKCLSEKMRNLKLCELDISYSKGLTGSLSVLFTQRLSSLTLSLRCPRTERFIFTIVKY